MHCRRTSFKPSITSRCRTATGEKVPVSGRSCTRQEYTSNTLEEEDDKHKYLCSWRAPRAANKTTAHCTTRLTQQLEHPPQEQKTFYLCSVRRVHTEPYPGCLPGYYILNFYYTTKKVLYGIYARTRNF